MPILGPFTTAADKVQIAVDAKHNLISEQQVRSPVSGLGLLAETAAAACENLADCDIDAVADRGYYKIGDIEACEAAGLTPYVPKPDQEQWPLSEV